MFDAAVHIAIFPDDVLPAMSKLPVAVRRFPNTARSMTKPGSSSLVCPPSIGRHDVPSHAAILFATNPVNFLKYPAATTYFPNPAITRMSVAASVVFGHSVQPASVQRYNELLL